MVKLAKKLQLSSNLQSLVKPIAKQTAVTAYSRIMETPRFLSPKLEEITISYRSLPLDRAGIRFFMREYVPSYRFHNPHVKINHVHQSLWNRKPSMATFKTSKFKSHRSHRTEDGKEHKFDISNREFDEIEKLFQAINTQLESSE